MTSDQLLLAWHFLPENGYTRFEPRIKVEPGQTLTIDPPLELCQRGLHASVRAIDALFYAPGPVVCRVELSGEILSDSDKVCAQHRKVLWMADATQVLHLFACDEAERALQFAGITDPRCFVVIETKRRWLEGKATIEELRAARIAALSTARCDVHSAGWYAHFAVYVATQSTARTAAQSATGAVVQSATRAAVLSTDRCDGHSADWDDRSATRAAQSATNERLTAALTQLAPPQGDNLTTV